MYQLVLLRHGESLWNKENRFTGWTDVDLSMQGLEEARTAGRILKKSGFSFDIAFTSLLKKAIRTLWIVLDEMDLMWIPVEKSWRLNERHYGALQGLNKSETTKQFGEEQVHLWRRSYDLRPPPLRKKERRKLANNPKYSRLRPDQLPITESLKDTLKRLLPYWNATIAPKLESGKNVIISAHGNSLRALVKYLDNVPDHKISELNIPTGIPLVYEFDQEMTPINHSYLGDPKKVTKALDSIVKQGKPAKT